jgi:Lon-like protease
MHNKLYEKVFKEIKENIWYIVTLIIVFLLFNIELPYAIEMPGGLISLNSRIKVVDASKESGSLNMTYVSMMKGTLPFLAISYFNNNWDTISQNDIKYDNETEKEMNEREKKMMNEAISNAEYVAYTKTNHLVNIKNTDLYIGYIDNSDTELKELDIVKKINNQEVNSLKEMQNIIQGCGLNDQVNFEIIRNNQTLNVISSIYLIDGVKKVGAAIIPNYDLELDPSINIDVKDNESGPSGGLMMALSIYDQLSGDDMTKGDIISGTGTIDMDGNVGEIGGVKYKLIGAVKNKAKVFLCPMENYDEAVNLAKERNYDIIIKGVASFDEAIDFLRGR